MNKELDKLLCLLDGKITAYRFIDDTNPVLPLIQDEIQKLWERNKEDE